MVHYNIQQMISSKDKQIPSHGRCNICSMGTDLGEV